jgi:signal peptidase II
MKHKLGCFLISLPVIFVLDQWTKHLVLSRFSYGESTPIIEGFFNLTYVRNTGAAFGMLASADPAFRVPFFLIVPMVALVVLGLLYKELPASSRYRATALSLITAGALGNLLDRIRFGYVVDFLDFHFRDAYHWPAFNVADAAISTGVVVLLIAGFMEKKGQVDASNAV